MQQEINKDSIVLIQADKVGYNVGDIRSYKEGAYEVSLFENIKGIPEFKVFYMYFIDKDAPMKEGSWVISSNNQLYQILKRSNGNLYLNGLGEDYSIELAKLMRLKAIIGSNDPKLIADGVTGISDEFIKQWVDVQGKEYKVMMETETKGICCTPMEGIRHHGTYCLTCDGYKEAQFPKLSNNQLVLSVVEEKQDNIITQLTEHLKNTPKEQLQKEWAEIEAMGFEGPVVAEFIGNQKAHSVEDSDIEAAMLIEYPNLEKGYEGVFYEKRYIAHEAFKKGVEWYKSQQQQKAIAFVEWIMQHTKPQHYPAGKVSYWYKNTKYTTAGIYQEWLKTQSK